MFKEEIKVLIVDDSRVARELLKYIIDLDSKLKVVGETADGEEAFEWLKHNTCDVITMDIHMPVLNGFTVTEKIMETKPIPTVIISSGYTSADKQMAFKALEAGALAILEKPVGIGDSTFKEKAKSITDTIKMIAGIKLITRRHKVTSHEEEISTPLRIPKNIDIKAVAIGASLGGPIAISEILSGLPSTFPVPIFIVQHIAPGFTEGFVSWLQERCALKVRLAKDKERAQSGYAYVASDGCQMEVNVGGLINLDFTPSSGGLQPSVARLFKSMANTYGSNCIGVILTGMGSDGAKELLLMSQKGAYTIAQDKESSVMFGMPNEAISLGAAREILPLNKIASALNHLVSKD